MRVFPECKFRFSYMLDFGRVKLLFIYVIWQVVGSIGYVARNTGVSVLVNKLLGPKVNAAMSVGNTLSIETSVLTGALNNAFGPALSTVCGTGDLSKMRRMAFMSCKFGLLLTLIFALPLSIEVEEVLRLWLKTPPDFAAELCLCLLVCVVLDKSTVGQVMAVNAYGKLARFQTIHGLSLTLVLPTAWLFFKLVPGVWSVGVALIVTMIFSILCDAVVAHKVVGINCLEWMKSIICPIIVLSVICLCCGALPSLFMTPSFIRVVVTTVVTLAFFFPITWFIVFSASERIYVQEQIKRRFRWVR